MSASRLINQQIRQDFDQILSPEEGGFVVIMNQSAPSNHRLTDADAAPGLKNVTYPSRSDQIGFIRRRGTLQSKTPAHSNTLFSRGSAPYVRVWYGHASLNGADNYDNNTIASRWILGRQALFLDGDGPGLLNENAPGLLKGGSQYHKVHISRLEDELPVRQSPFSPTNPPNSKVYAPPGGYGANKALYEGYTDICGESLADVTARTQGSNRTMQSCFNQLVRTIYPHNRRKLWVLGTQSDPGKSVNFARNHAYFATGVSSFIIQFAYDADSSSGPGTPDGKVDRNSQGEIRWYDSNNPPETPTASDGSYLPFFAIAGGSPPKTIAMPNTVTGPPNSMPVALFVFPSRVNPNLWRGWPDLIRIRYRLHDEMNRTGEENADYAPGAPNPAPYQRRQTMPGRWFELILETTQY